ncbi:hypothetical protein XSR1_30010 [Xenorhabdus szentirmaii DSM 16338]|uniref:Uncharacterized protein n=1 Tax=Xenorhabdus szentirmaii DSM 16338 TaxID=1427518 RepID=W1IXH0_9GAMM|nr:hypothetical protein XSR1_30010 [Xenorhabdus szentirmaii DSM 16338]
MSSTGRYNAILKQGGRYYEKSEYPNGSSLATGNWHRVRNWSISYTKGTYLSFPSSLGQAVAV